MIEENELYKKIMSMNKKDWVQTLVVYFMIIMLCITFYALGYGKASQNTVEVANKIIIELISENKPNMKSFDLTKTAILDGYMYNLSNEKLTRTGG